MLCNNDAKLEFIFDLHDLSRQTGEKLLFFNFFAFFQIAIFTNFKSFQSLLIHYDSFTSDDRQRIQYCFKLLLCF